MRAYVITIRGHPDSERAAIRCIETAGRWGLKVEIFDAITPAHDPEAMFAARGWPTEKFTNNRWSRPLPCMSCFLSHAALWHESAFSGHSVLICEHDAVFVRPFPTAIHDTAWAVNLCHPSFGKFTQPTCGLSPMKHKPTPHYMGGATCYLVRTQAAREFLRLAPKFAEPTDIYMNLGRFPFLRDYFPWIAECHDTFSTIQKEEGCAAKHHPVRMV